MVFHTLLVIEPQSMELDSQDTVPQKGMEKWYQTMRPEFSETSNDPNAPPSKDEKWDLVPEFVRVCACPQAVISVLDERTHKAADSLVQLFRSNPDEEDPRGQQGDPQRCELQVLSPLHKHLRR